MKTKLTIAMIAWGALASAAVTAGSEDDWQLSMLFAPTLQQLKMESEGRVFIYDGLTDAQVGQAMDGQFGRVQSMMFVRTVVTNTQGTPLREPDTGELVVEDDGCE
jgi:hypothetical protein